MTPVNRWGILWFFLICGVISLVIWVRTKKYDSFSWTKPFEISYLIPRGNRDTLQLKKLVENLSGSYAILVYHLFDQTWYGINEDMEMPAASIMKVPIMTAVLNLLNLDDTYILRNADKQSGSGSIEFMREGTALTIKELVTEMGKKSDNTATSVLSQKVGDEAVVKILSDWKMDKTDYGKNTITANDVSKMWQQVYKKPDMWEYLQDSIYEDRITLGLPEGTKFVHKVGTDNNIWSDSGIIQCSVLSTQCSINPFILVILTKDINREEAEKIVPEITKIIWEHEVKTAGSQSPSPVPPAPLSE